MSEVANQFQIRPSKKLSGKPTFSVTWTMPSGITYYVLSDNEKFTHHVYVKEDGAYLRVYSTKDYYSIGKELERREN